MIELVYYPIEMKIVDILTKGVKTYRFESTLHILK